MAKGIIINLSTLILLAIMAKYFGYTKELLKNDFQDIVYKTQKVGGHPGKYWDAKAQSPQLVA